jgi:hypothetical protein
LASLEQTQSRGWISRVIYLRSRWNRISRRDPRACAPPPPSHPSRSTASRRPARLRPRSDPSRPLTGVFARRPQPAQSARTSPRNDPQGFKAPARDRPHRNDRWHSGRGHQAHTSRRGGFVERSTLRRNGESTFIRLVRALTAPQPPAEIRLRRHSPARAKAGKARSTMP